MLKISGERCYLATEAAIIAIENGVGSIFSSHGSFSTSTKDQKNFNFLSWVSIFKGTLVFSILYTVTHYTKR